MFRLVTKAAIGNLAIHLGKPAKKLAQLTTAIVPILAYNSEEILLRKRALAVSIDKGRLSLLLASRRNRRIRIEKFREHLFDNQYPKPGDVAAALMPMIGAATGRREADIVLILPKPWVVTRIAELPRAVRENLSGAVASELDRLTPFHEEEALFDYRIVEESDGRIRVLLIAARKATATSYLEALGEIGIEVNRLTTSLSAIATLCALAGHDTSLFLRSSGSGVEGCSISSGLPVSAFSVESSRGEESRSDTSEFLDSISSAITPWIADSGGEANGLCIILPPGDPVKGMLGDRPPLPIKELAEKDCEGFEVSPENPVPIDHVAWGGVAEALWRGAKPLDLLARGAVKGSRPPVILTGLLLVSILAALVISFIVPLGIERDKLEQIGREIGARKGEIKAVEALKKDTETLEKEMSAINDFKEGRPSVLGILKELTAILPKTVWLTGVRFSNTSVNIEGYAPSAVEILSKLESSKLFRKAEFSSPTFRDNKLRADKFAVKMEIDEAERGPGKIPEHEDKK